MEVRVVRRETLAFLSLGFSGAIADAYWSDPHGYFDPPFQVFPGDCILFAGRSHGVEHRLNIKRIKSPEISPS